MRKSALPLGISIAVFGAIAALRWVGWLQFAELIAFDHFLRILPRGVNNNVVVVSIDNKTLRDLKEEDKNDTYDRTISLIAQEEPVAIMFDVGRDLEKQGTFERYPFLWGARVVGDDENYEIPKRYGAVNFPADGDGVARRMYALRFYEGKPIPGLGFLAAELYLREKHGIKIELTPDDRMTLGEATLPHVVPRFGPYRKSGGYPFVMTYTNYGEEVSMRDVLDGKISPELFKGKVVFVGDTADSTGADAFFSPFSRRGELSPQRIRGVQIHAHAAAQIIEAALGNEHPIDSLPEWAENLYILAWTAATVAPIWLLRRRRLFVGYGVAIAAGVSGAGVAIAFAAFASNGLWLPVVPVALAAVAGGVVAMQTAHIVGLNALVAARTRELEQANRDLAAAQEQLIADEKLKTLGALLAGLAHSMGNRIQNIYWPLSTGKTALETLKDRDDLPKDVIEEITDFAEDYTQIFDEVQLIERAQKFFLSSFEVEKGEAIDPNNLIRFCVDSTHKMLEADAITLSVDLDEDLFGKTIAPFQFYHAVISLIYNARDAIVKKREQHPDLDAKISLSTKEDESQVTILVEDNGVGIDPESLDRLFEFGFSTKPAGHGIGLYVSKLIATKYGGDVFAESRLGEGSRFIISLPQSPVT